MRVNQYSPASAQASPKPEKHPRQSMDNVTAVGNTPVRFSGVKDGLQQLEDGMKNLTVDPGAYQRPPFRNTRREPPFDNSVQTAPKQQQTEHTPATSADPASTLANLFASAGVTLTATNDAEGMISEFATHVQVTLASKKFLYQKKLYLTHITRLLDNMSSRLSTLEPEPAPHGKLSALHAVTTYKSDVEYALKQCAVLLEQEEGPSAYQRPAMDSTRREGRL